MFQCGYGKNHCREICFLHLKHRTFGPGWEDASWLACYISLQHNTQTSKYYVISLHSVDLFYYYFIIFENINDKRVDFGKC